MESFFKFWDTHFLPSIAKFYNNNYLIAIRRTFYVLMPFWLTVSFFDLIGNVFLNPTGILFDNGGLNLGFWLTGLTGEDYLHSNFAYLMLTYKKIISVGYNIVTMIITITLSARLAEIWQSDKTMTIFCSGSAFLIVYSLAPTHEPQVSDYFSEMGFFSAFLLTFISARIFSWLYHKKPLFIKVPKYLPQEMAKYLSAIFPVALTLIFFPLLIFVLSILITATENFFAGISDLTFFQNPLFVIFYQLIVWILGWLGLPGYAMTSVVLDTAYIPAQINNQIGETVAIFTTGFFEAGVIQVLGLMIAILVFSQHDNWRKVTKFSMPLMLFNVQEVFIFGLPVILNPIFILPYVFAPIANCLVGYVAISWGIVPVFQTDIPWTMPLVLGAGVATHSVMGGLLQIVWLIMDIFIYAPFVITANSIELENENRI